MARKKVTKSMSSAPIFEGIILLAEDKATAQRIARRHALRKWTITALGEGAADFLMRPPKAGKPLSVAEAWGLTHTLREDRDVAAAEPAFVTSGVDPAAKQVLRPGIKGAFGKTPPLPESDDCEWSIKLCKVPKAWAFSESQQTNGARPQGEGIKIAHPDTGYTEHPDFFDQRVLVAEGKDFEDNDNDAEDPLTGNAASHGTSTGSVIMSAVGPDGVNHVTGAAPQALLIPLRVKDSVIHFSYANLCESLYYAAAQGYHVVSMSLGGPISSDALLRALQHVASKGIIMIAASGNHYPAVIYPAKYEECIAVCACNARREIWSGASAGDDVDVTGPGESVWRARTENGQFLVARGDGTSYATATVAGIAALWLAHHGRDRLVQLFPGKRLVSVFKELLMRHGVDTDPGWETDRHGTGIVNALKLLQAALPDSAPAIGVKMRATKPKPKQNDVDRIAAYYPELSPAQVRKLLARSLAVSDRQLNDALAEVADELAFHIATDPTVRFGLLDVVKPIKKKGMTVKAVKSPRRMFKHASPQLKSKLT
jgi:serine protease